MIKEKMFIVPAEKEQSAVQQTKQSRRITVFYLLYLLLFRVQIKVEDTLFYKSQIVCTKTQKHMPWNESIGTDTVQKPFATT